MELDITSRKHDILVTAIDDFIRTAQPITSASLNETYDSISSATLRNELNSLEAMGLLRQLHTSGGRVPTSDGYRTYVDHVMRSNVFDESQVCQVKKDYEATSVNLMSTLTTFAKGLSQLTNCPTVLLQKGLENLKIINIQLVPLILKDGLLLVETECGVIDESLPLSQEMDRSSCIEASQYLTTQFKGKTIKYMFDNINDYCLRAGGQVMQFKALIDVVIKVLTRVTKMGVNISHEGTTKLYSALTDEEQTGLKKINKLLENKTRVADMIEESVTDTISCKIGQEQDDELKGGMMMTTPIVINGVSIASLALIAPQRVDYASLAAAMKFISSQIQRLNEKGDKNG